MTGFDRCSKTDQRFPWLIAYCSSHEGSAGLHPSRVESDRVERPSGGRALDQMIRRRVATLAAPAARAIKAAITALPASAIPLPVLGKRTTTTFPGAIGAAGPGAG